MHKQLLEYIQHHRLVTDGDTTIMAVSGGVDSVVLAHLFFKAGLKFVIAHCNFHLRGEESEGDEVYVRELACQYRVPCFVKQCDTKRYAEKHKVGIQVAARELRFDFFRILMKEHNFSAVATAHHHDDQIETFFINLLRGSGINGLQGIKPRNREIIHPLLFATRAEIESYAVAQHMTWREDSSNDSDYYLRNKIRHHLTPVFSQMEPSFSAIMQGNFKRLQGAAMIYNSQIEAVKANVMQRDGKFTIFSIEKLLKCEPLPVYLYELLSEFGVNSDQVAAIIPSLQQRATGNRFLTSRYEIVVEREYLIVAPKNSSGKGKFLINRSNISITIPITLDIISKSACAPIEIPKEPTIAVFDKDKITFPLALRKWRHGDFFVPFGMTGKKKLSDFFTDNKLSFRAKEETWLLCSGENIIWVVGSRIDNRFAVTNETEQLLFIRYTPKEN